MKYELSQENLNALAAANEHYFGDDPFDKFTPVGRWKGYIVFVCDYPDCLTYMLLSETVHKARPADKEQREIYKISKQEIEALFEEEE